MLTWGDGVARRRPRRAARVPPRPRQARDADGRAAAGPLRRPRPSTATRDREFTEKPQIGEGWINGGFFVLEPAIFDYIDGDATHLGSASRWSGSPRTAS